MQGVYAYAERIKGKPLSLVDSTGFSWESVNATLARLGQENLPDDVWSPELFAGRRDDLRRMMGLLLQVPELQDSLKNVTGGTSPDGDKLAQIICAWVQGRPLIEMATDYFREAATGSRHCNDQVLPERVREVNANCIVGPLRASVTHAGKCLR